MIVSVGSSLFLLKYKSIMRKFLTLFVLAMLMSCNEDHGYSISGSIDDVPDGQKIYVSQLNEDNNQTTTIDTVEVIDGRFELDLPENESPTISFLALEGQRGNVLFIADDSPVTFELNKDSLYASTVEGGKDNKILYDYLGEIQQTNKKVSDLRTQMMQAYSNEDSAQIKNLEASQQEIIEEDQENKRELVGNNPESLVSLMVLQDMMNSKAFSNAEVREFFENLSPDVRHTFLGQTVKDEIEQLSLTDIGSKAPNFSAPTPSGEELALEDVLGKVTLIDFWAAWCKPCRRENPNIVKVYEKYHDQGFNIIGVSLDRPQDKDRWLKAIEDDNLTWNQVSNLMFWQDPIARKYGVRAIPAAFLLDEDGVIIAKDLRGQDLEEGVAKALGEE